LLVLSQEYDPDTNVNTSKHIYNSHKSWTYMILVYYRYVTKPTGNIGLFDPTEIHNRQQLKYHMKENLCKMGFHLIFFFIYLYL